MGDWRRYAIYYTATGPLAAFGARWLGRDIVSGAESRPLGAGIESLTRTARRYGFHATLKAPFRLAADTSEAALRADLHTLTASQPPVALQGGLRLASLHGFPALVQAQPCPALQDLAARVVRELDPHRAPLTPEDRSRRQPDRLSPAQRNLLDRWGYPFVLGQFRFHMTLGARLEQAQCDAVIAALRPHLTPLLPDPQIIDALTLAGEDSAGRFHQIVRLRLRDGRDAQ